MSKCLILLAIACVALVQADEFANFMQQYNKAYSTNEFAKRRAIFYDTLAEIDQINSENRGWTAGVNEWSDLTWEEFKGRFLMAPQKCSATEGMPHVKGGVNVDPVDWRNKGVVTPVKNQGSCGSCWAFSTTGTMEGAIQIASKTLPNLSEQQLVDCAKTPNTKGCSGGWPWAAGGWAITNGGLCSQKDYAYTGRDGTCKKCTPLANIKTVVQQKGEDQLLVGVNLTPVSICLDASGGFQSYRSGVFAGPCGSQMNHAVLAVGYTDAYWIVKNSWGTSWGEQGYIRMARGKNLCGMSNVLFWPTA